MSAALCMASRTRPPSLSQKTARIAGSWARKNCTCRNEEGSSLLSQVTAWSTCWTTATDEKPRRAQPPNGAESHSPVTLCQLLTVTFVFAHPASPIASHLQSGLSSREQGARHALICSESTSTI